MNGCQCRVNENRARQCQLREAKKGKLRLHSLRLNILLAWDANDTHEDAEFFLTGYRFLWILLRCVRLLNSRSLSSLTFCSVLSSLSAVRRPIPAVFLTEFPVTVCFQRFVVTASSRGSVMFSWSDDVKCLCKCRYSGFH